MRRIRLAVDGQGRVTADFSGFPGEDCREEEAKLRQMLAGLGVALEIGAITAKEPAVIAAEAGLDEEVPGEVRHR